MHLESSPKAQLNLSTLRNCTQFSPEETVCGTMPFIVGLILFRESRDCLNLAKLIKFIWAFQKSTQLYSVQLNASPGGPPGKKAKSITDIQQLSVSQDQQHFTHIHYWFNYGGQRRGLQTAGLRTQQAQSSTRGCLLLVCPRTKLTPSLARWVQGQSTPLGKFRDTQAGVALGPCVAHLQGCQVLLWSHNSPVSF